MARMHHWLGLAALSFTLVGCVSQDKHTALKMERDRFAEQLAQAQTEASSARSEAEAYKSQLAAIMNGKGSSEAMILNLTQQNVELQKQLDDLNRRYAEAMNRPAAFAALPEPLSNALSDFAQQNPDLVEFDASKGIVKFKSDVTFATGSADLTPKAKEAISRFSQILSSPAASGYELMVAGHTDNTRVVNPQTISAGHKDNWYLSAHRAISVGGALLSSNINAQRLAVTGYADQRPAASNTSESGRAQNRRVEVLILPNTVRTASSGSTGGSSAPRAALPNKDASATINAAPALPNK